MTQANSGSGSGLMSPDELRESVETELRAGRESQIRKDVMAAAESIIAQARAEMVRSGYTIEFFVQVDLEWLSREALNKILWNSGWYLEHQGSKLTWIVSPREEEPRLVPTYHELLDSVRAEVRAGQSAEERTQPARLARSILDQVRQQIVQTGTRCDYPVNIGNSLHWMVRDDLRELLDKSGWHFSRIGEDGQEAGYKVSANMHFRDTPVLQTERQLKDEVEQSMQSPEVDNHARRVAEAVIAAIRAQIAATGSRLDYQVDVDRSANWLVIQKAEKLLEKAGWQAWTDPDRKMNVSPKHKGGYAFF
ncbi:MAG: hypothetical protein KC777_27405 [Cyanobacteria bacterium HKST-UBA02]|nr:hypothetical protein [Cyanobacteria bacterium HKST-UBA02]